MFTTTDVMDGFKAPLTIYSEYYTGEDQLVAKVTKYEYAPVIVGDDFYHCVCFDDDDPDCVPCNAVLYKLRHFPQASKIW